MEGNISKKRGLVSEITNDDLDYISVKVEATFKKKADADSVYTKSDIDSLLDGKQDTLTFDDTPTSGSNNPVKSDGIKTELDKKANTSDVYTRTEVDTELDKKANTTEVYTKAETDTKLDKKQNILTFDDTPTVGSNNPVKSGGVKAALDGKADKGGVYKKNEVYNKSEIDSKLLNVYTHYRGASDLSTFYMTANANQVLDYTFSETEFTYDVNITYPSNTAIWNLSFSVDEDYGYSKTEVLLASSHCPFLNVGNKITIKFDDGARCETTVISNDSFSLTAIGNFTYAPKQGDGSIDKSRVVSLILSCTIYVKHGDNIALVELSDKSRFLDNLSGKSQSVLIFDSTPTAGSENPVTSNGIKTAIDCLKSASIPHTTVSGYPMTVTDHLGGENVLDYKIYGNSVQNGTPAADTPIDIQSVGDLVTDTASEYYGKYDIPLYVGGVLTTHIYLNAPLRKVGNSADYIDFKTQKVVRYIKEQTFNGSEAWNYRDSDHLLHVSVPGLASSAYCVSTHFLDENRKDSSTTPYLRPVTNVLRLYQQPSNILWSTAAEFKAFLTAQKTAGTPLIVDYVLSTPTEESISAADFSLPDGEIVSMAAGTETAPSKIDLEYYQDINKVIAEIKAAILSNGGNV